jgi:hypothetical protein
VKGKGKNRKKDPRVKNRKIHKIKNIILSLKYTLHPSPRHFSAFSSDRQYKTKHHLHLQNTPTKMGAKMLR